MASLPDHLLPAAVGRERVSKDVLAEHQRQRVLEAATAVFADLGYQATTVDRIVSAARIGVGSFYGLFEGKEDCFLRLYDRIVGDAEARIAAAASEGQGEERVTKGLRTILELVAAEPRRAQVVVVEAPTAGQAANERYARTVDRLAAALCDGRSSACGEGSPAAFGRAAVAGVAWTLHQRLALGEPVVVEELLPEVAEFLLAPYVAGDSGTAIR